MTEKKYDCSVCNFRDRMINFCGFCTRRILDEMKEAKGNNAEQNTLSTESESIKQAL